MFYCENFVKINKPILMLANMLPNFTRRQWYTLAIIGLADFANAICVSLQAPFFPQEVNIWTERFYHSNNLHNLWRISCEFNRTRANDSRLTKTIWRVELLSIICFLHIINGTWKGHLHSLFSEMIYSFVRTVHCTATMKSYTFKEIVQAVIF